MRTVADVLRHADPLRHEPERTSHERRRSRQRVLASARAVEQPQRSRVTIVGIAAVALVAIAAGYWSVAAAMRFEVRLAEERPAAGLREIAVSGTRKIYVQERALVTNSDIARAEVVPGAAPSRFSVSITFTADGAARMLRATQGHIGRPVAILLDGDVVMAPVVKSPISTSATITGDYTEAQARRIVAGIGEP